MSKMTLQETIFGEKVVLLLELFTTCGQPFAMPQWATATIFKRKQWQEGQYTFCTPPHTVYAFSCIPVMKWTLLFLTDQEEAIEMTFWLQKMTQQQQIKIEMLLFFFLKIFRTLKYYME